MHLFGTLKDTQDLTSYFPGACVRRTSRNPLRVQITRGRLSPTWTSAGSVAVPKRRRGRRALRRLRSLQLAKWGRRRGERRGASPDTRGLDSRRARRDDALRGRVVLERSGKGAECLSAAINRREARLVLPHESGSFRQLGRETELVPGLVKFRQQPSKSFQLLRRAFSNGKMIYTRFVSARNYRSPCARVPVFITYKSTVIRAFINLQYPLKFNVRHIYRNATALAYHHAIQLIIAKTL